jgi:hypothetical protein
LAGAWTESPAEQYRVFSASDTGSIDIEPLVKNPCNYSLLRKKTIDYAYNLKNKKCLIFKSENQALNK